MTEFVILKLGSFMKKILAEEAFDSFLLEQGTLKLAGTWSFDGHCNKGYYTSEEWDDPSVRPYDIVPWSDVRSCIYEMFKGKRSPESFRFVLQLKPEYLDRTLGQSAASLFVRSLVMQVRYDGSKACIVSGVSYSGFTPDKAAEKIWDTTLSRFLESKGIEFSIS